MDVVRDIEALGSACPRPILAIGNFDGVHRGHQAVLAQIVARAREVDGTAMVLSFDPHPIQVLRPELMRPQIFTPAQKRRHLEALGVQVLFLCPFSVEFSRVTPAEFARDVLARGLRIEECHVGSGFRFGADRAGDVDDLRRFGEEWGFGFVPVTHVTVDGKKIGSSQVRACIERGDVEEATDLMGHAYSMSGVVVRGAGRGGSDVGFPTLNLESENRLLPATGVYISRAAINGEHYPSVTNVGVRPTLATEPSDAGPSVHIETHLLDHEGDYYGQRMAVEFVEQLRAERRFDTVDDLRDQIGRDVRVAADYWQRHA